MALETCFVNTTGIRLRVTFLLCCPSATSPWRIAASISALFLPALLSKQSIQVFAKDEVVFQTQLYGQVQPNKATIQVTPFKIEVRLDKTSNERWATLSVEDTSSSTTAVAQSESQTTNKGDVQLPKKKQPNWDKGKDAEEEELENSDPSTKLFKKIYAGSDDETRRAMLKSMQESNGTVLNTNWAEVGKKKITPYKSKDSEEEGQDGQDD
uniref:SGS domain-containing protein n=1 Tax=Ditylenchus dipsaci TaxID=166011 RepID=A0A915DN33_9BILA